MKDIHLKLRVGNGNGRPQDAVGWRMAERASRHSMVMGDLLDLAFSLDYNSHPDFAGVQLNLIDFKRSDDSAK